MLLVSIGAAVGLIYALQGGEALMVISNPDGRSNYLYLTTMTNWKLGNVIRPSGIFDEPGALSFVICYTCACRHILNLPRKKTWVLLFLGFSTLSMAHAIYFFFHLISEKLDFRRMLRQLPVFFVVVIVLLLNESIRSVFYDFLVKRFAFTGSGFTGDNRTVLISNAFSYLDLRSFFWGLDSSCIADVVVCNSRYDSFGENPLSLLVLTGIGPSLPYYFYTPLLLLIGITNRRNGVLFGAGLLLLQRPNIMSYGYAPLICLLIAIALYSNSKSREIDDFSR